MKWCPECEKRSYKEEVCTNCGLVFEDKPVDYRPPISLQDKSAMERSHIIYSKFQKGIGRKSTVRMSEVKNPDLKRALRKYYYPWEAKRDSKIRDELKRIVQKLNLGKDFYTACYYHYNKIAKYNKENKKNLFKGAKKVSIEIVAQGIAFLEIKQQGIPRTLKDFQRIGCDKKDVMDYYKRLLREFNIKIKPQDPMKFISGIVVSLELESRKELFLATATNSFMEKIIMIEKRANLISQFRNPIDKAGSCIYLLTSEDGVTQQKICDIIGCSLQTLRRRVNELKSIISRFFQRFRLPAEEPLDCGEYENLVNNVATSCDAEKELINCLINPKFKLDIVITDDKYLPIFSCDE